MPEAQQLFLDMIRSNGLVPPHDIVPGKFHRFPGIGKCSSNRAGWCLLFKDGLGGCFGDGSSGLSETWQEQQRSPLTPAARANFSRQVKQAIAQAEAERSALQTSASMRAAMIWDNSTPAPFEHPYLVRKGIRADSAKLYKSAIILPLLDFTGQLTSLQFIDSHGSKRLLSGGRKQGCFIPISTGAQKICRVIICEGWATGRTLAEHDPVAKVLAAVDANNLVNVAVGARRHWPNIDMVIAGDDDRLTPDNPGASKAREAAITVGARIALPQWPADAPEYLTDFNDLAVWLAGGIQ